MVCYKALIFLGFIMRSTKEFSVNNLAKTLRYTLVRPILKSVTRYLELTYYKWLYSDSEESNENSQSMRVIF